MAHTRKAMETRRRILAAAAGIIGRQGLSRTRLEEVLRESDVQKGNFYYYFRSKADLGSAVLQEQFQPHCLSWLDDLLPAAADLRFVREFFISAFPRAVAAGDDWLSPLVQLALEVCQSGDAARLQAESTIQAISDFLSSRLADHTVPDDPHRPLDPGLLLVFGLQAASNCFMLDRKTEQLQASVQLQVEQFQILAQHQALAS